ncbi:MAG: HupE/UreJ family protein [Bacteroidota bacterium]
MSEFQTYLQLGFEHILDLEGYDHILFIVALCAIYKVEQWKKILVLVTAFTIGHSITLALAALDIVRFSPSIIEFLIPVTILLTALYNVFKTNHNQHKAIFNYLLALLFGLIHGLGFSNFFKALLGQEESIVKPLFAFNIGVELGQLIIVGIIMFVAFLVMNVFRAKQRDWVIFISGAAAGIALTLILGSELVSEWMSTETIPRPTFE